MENCICHAVGIHREAGETAYISLVPIHRVHQPRFQSVNEIEINMASCDDVHRSEPRISSTAEDRLRQWLGEINLQQYADRFYEEGYDDITQIILMNEAEIDEMLQETGLEKKAGHKKRFKSNWIILRSKENAHRVGVENPTISKQNHQVAPDSFQVPAYLIDLEIPNVGTSRRLQYYNGVLKQISQSADGLVSPLQLHDYIVSQREKRWSIKEDSDQLEHEKASLLDPTSGYGQNIAKYSGRNDLLTAADVHKCANTVKALNVLNVKFQGMKDELIDQRKNIFDKTTLKIKEWKANELSFYDSVLKCVIDGINEIDAKSALLNNTKIFLNGRFPGFIDIKLFSYPLIKMCFFCPPSL
eukprot:Seg1753.6 transcript_id=Seg1753.6/GoldUCD/mRNA.D3Y31 product="hypothetical protein" protein_id=Seg1753.6/GoldUCD/D3Y31